MIHNSFLIPFVVISFFFGSGIANSTSYVFYCSPWEDRLTKVLMENNFSIKINNEELTIIGGDQPSKFANLIFVHPNFYLFASPSGSLTHVSRNEGPKKVSYWDSYDMQDFFYSSTCNN
mgnify:CR=1 FL=1